MTKSTYLKTAGLTAAAAFAIALAVLIGDRLSTEAIAVLAGAVCGVGAAIPTSLLIIAVTQRARQHAETTQAPQQPQYTPPIVMMTPPVQIQPQAPTPPPTIWKDAPIQRHFTTIGEQTGQEE